MRQAAKFKLFVDLGGGLSVRPTPLLVESAKGAMQSPDLRNADFYRRGGISKRLGKSKIGDTLTASAAYSDTGASATNSLAASALSGGNRSAIAVKFTAAGVTAIGSVEMQLAVNNVVGSGPSPAPNSVVCYLAADSSGAPENPANWVQIGNLTLPNSTTPTSVTFSGGTRSTTAADWWIVVAFNNNAPGETRTLYYKGSATGSKVFKSADADTAGTFTADGTKAAYFKAYATTISLAVQGLHDYRHGSSNTREQVVTANGSIYKRDKSGSAFVSTWTALTTGLTAGQDVLSSFATLKDYLFIANYGNSAPRVWDGAAAYTMALGRRATFTASDDGGGGTIGNGTYKIMTVTTLKSGGYRSSAEVSVTMAGGGTQQIAVASLDVNGADGSDFGFDIDTAATMVFMTEAGGSIYYAVPVANISTGANPIGNTATGFNITATTGLTSENTLLEQYGLDQTYFTNQIDTPSFKYLVEWQDFLVGAGQTATPNRVYFSEQEAPQIWSNEGGLDGNYLDFPSDGDTITGLFQWNGALYVFKRHSIHIVEFTGNAQAPFATRKLPGELGALSGFSFVDIGAALLFLSERGVCALYGTSAQLVPGMEEITSYFEPNYASKFNLTATAYATAGHNRTKNQVWWGVSSTSATTRDLVLVYDYERKAFWLNSGMEANYIASIGDASSFYSVWSGDYSGRIYQHESGYLDDATAISWYFTTPHLGLGDPYGWKHIDRLFVAGDKQTTGDLTIEVFCDRSTTAARTLTMSMTTDAFQTGATIPIGVRCKTAQLKFSQSTASVPTHIDAFGLYFIDSGPQV